MPAFDPFQYANLNRYDALSLASGEAMRRRGVATELSYSRSLMLPNKKRVRQMSKLLEYCFAFFFFAALAEGGAYIFLNIDSFNNLPVFDGIRLDDSVYTLKRNYTQHWSTDEFDVVVATNSDGFREDKDFSLKDLDA